jgi:glucose-6-phosphate dehydrogenase assembly protein OpcA
MKPSDAPAGTPAEAVSPRPAPAAAALDCCREVTGHPVNLARVDLEFSDLWRRAVQNLGHGEDIPIVRACLWNIVVVHSSSSDSVADPVASGSPDLDSLLEEATLSVPARIISLRKLPSAAGDAVEANLAIRCVKGPSGAATVVCEEVAIAATEGRGAEHFPALVRSLLVPDLPVALLWLDGLPRRGRLVNQLAQLSDRILIDSRSPGPISGLVELHELVRSTRALVTDLAWSRLTPMRYLLASLFDPPGHAENLKALERVHLESTPPGRNQGLLLLSWLLARCGETRLRAVDLAVRPVPPLEHFRWQVTHTGRRPHAVDLETCAGSVAGGYDGILKLQIDAAGQQYALERVDAEHVVLKSPHSAERKVALHGWGEADLLVSALGARRGDPLYAEALELAAEMMDQELWNA